MRYGYLLRWFAAIYLVGFFAFPLSSGLRAIEHLQSIFWSYFGVTLFSVFAAYPMTKYLGLAGVMGGILALSFIQLLTLWIGLKKNLAS